MKTEQAQQIIRKGIVVVAMVVGLTATSTMHAQRGTGGMIEAKPLETTQDIEALQSGDMVVMNCPKCKSTSVSYVEEGRGAVKPIRVGEKHMCPGCGAVIETKGTGRQAKDEIVHVCQKCGSKDAYCCSIKKGDITKGMEKER